MTASLGGFGGNDPRTLKWKVGCRFCRSQLAGDGGLIDAIASKLAPTGFVTGPLFGDLNRRLSATLEGVQSLLMTG